MTDQRISRRRLLGLSGALGASALLPACTGGGQSSEASQAATAAASGPVSGAVTWWDQYRPLTKLFTEDVFAGYMKQHTAVKVTRREMPAPDLAQALQIGRRSKQLPDVHSIAGLEAAPAALVSEGWFSPIGDLVDVENSPVGPYLYDGIHRFDGKVYTFPVFTGRWHDAIPWTNTALLKAAGVDPATSPATWDEFRATARTLTEKTPDDVFGLVVPGKEAPYLDALVNRLAMTAGGSGGVDWKTGEYAYGSQPYLDAFEYLVSLKTDKVVHPASPSMGPRDARARWAAGQAVVYMWGPWFIGGLNVEEPEAVQRGVGVWHVPTPETTRNLVYSSPASGPFWVSSASKNPKTAADLMLRLATEEVQSKLASTMDVPPVLLDRVKGSKAHPTYQQNVAFMEQDVRIAPVPEVGTPGVAKVLATMRDIHPNVGEIAQSVLSGSDVDYKSALSNYAGKVTAERERALKAASKGGAEVDVNAWVFANWDPKQDYTQKSYDGR
ncbi:ABC transporter substrate-binding protein [Kribbella sp. NPDC050470]|uniref:ABC transporter substrate-binding protein n=1 Tax=unclassified Kribbella TaxID=2644121 RepID=UPI0037A5CAFB